MSRDVAQSGSAPEWGSGGRRFKSSRPDHFTFNSLYDNKSHTVPNPVFRIMSKTGFSPFSVDNSRCFSHVTCPPPLIAFLSDFGLKDSYAGTVKGVIARINPDARVIDITHGIPPQDIMAGALILANAVNYFPDKTIFLAVVDPGVGSDRRGIVVELDSCVLVVPDNGLATPLLKDPKWTEIRCFYLEDQRSFLEKISNTFHARDIFAPVAAHLSMGVRPEEFGSTCPEPVMLHWPEPVIGTKSITGKIIYIDSFGNLITNVHALMVDLQRPLTARIKSCSEEIPFRKTYSNVEPGRPLCIESSFGLLEIAINQGNAAKVFKAGTGDPVFFSLNRPNLSPKPVDTYQRT